VDGGAESGTETGDNKAEDHAFTPFGAHVTTESLPYPGFHRPV